MSWCSSAATRLPSSRKPPAGSSRKAEKDAAKNALKGPQNALKSQIEALGGTVVATYQSSYNGIKVRIARDKADSSRRCPA